MKNTLVQYLKDYSRNKLVITGELPVLNMEGIDIGRALSHALKGKASSKHLPILAEEQLSRILNERVSYRKEIGKYLALQNVGILLESALGIDLKKLLSVYSQNNVLFLEWPGEKEGDTLYFLSKEKGKTVSLQGISHLMI